MREAAAVVQEECASMHGQGLTGALYAAGLSFTALGRSKKSESRLAHSTSRGAARNFARAGGSLCRSCGGWSRPHLLRRARVLRALIVFLIRGLLEGFELALVALHDGGRVALADHADGACRCGA